MRLFGLALILAQASTFPPRDPDDHQSGYGSRSLPPALSPVPIGPTPAPIFADIERDLHSREFCLVSIDACLDGEGRQIIPNNRYSVSNVNCRRIDLPPRRDAAIVRRSALCRFLVETTTWIDGQRFGLEKITQGRGTFDQKRFDDGTDASGKRRYEYVWRRR